MTEEEPVLCEVDTRGVASVTLNRPLVGNAYNGGLIDALIATFARLEREAALRCVVVKGAGKHFQLAPICRFSISCAACRPRRTASFRAARSRRSAACRRFRGRRSRWCRAAALAAGSASRRRVISRSPPRMRCSQSARCAGASPAPIVPLLVERIGARNAGRFALTGERFDAATARAIGLVHEVCAAAELERAGARVVDHLLMAGPEAVAITKRLIAEAVETPFDSFHDRIVEEAASRRQSAEAAEGLASFREKRPPKWYPKKS